jgi:hypothetical protein
MLLNALDCSDSEAFRNFSVHVLQRRMLMLGSGEVIWKSVWDDLAGVERSKRVLTERLPASYGWGEPHPWDRLTAVSGKTEWRQFPSFLA